MATSWFSDWFSGFYVCRGYRNELATYSSFYSFFNFMSLLNDPYYNTFVKKESKALADAYAQTRNKYNARRCSAIMLAHLEMNVDPALKNELQPGKT